MDLIHLRYYCCCPPSTPIALPLSPSASAVFPRKHSQPWLPLSSSLPAWGLCSPGLPGSPHLAQWLHGLQGTGFQALTPLLTCQKTSQGEIEGWEARVGGLDLVSWGGWDVGDVGVEREMGFGGFLRLGMWLWLDAGTMDMILLGSPRIQRT